MKVYYINLNKRFIKRKFMEEQLSSFNLNYSRIEGVLCNDFKNYKIKDYIEEGSKRHQGTIGCFLAHKNCLEEISRTKEENNIDPPKNKKLDKK